MSVFFAWQWISYSLYSLLFYSLFFFCLFLPFSYFLTFILTIFLSLKSPSLSLFFHKLLPNFFHFLNFSLPFPPTPSSIPLSSLFTHSLFLLPSHYPPHSLFLFLFLSVVSADFKLLRHENDRDEVFEVNPKQGEYVRNNARTFHLFLFISFYFISFYICQ